jgi:hypothetical protein
MKGKSSVIFSNITTIDSTYDETKDKETGPCENQVFCPTKNDDKLNEELFGCLNSEKS